MSKFIKTIGIFIIGAIVGAVEENLRYSIIHHEAAKGDVEAQKIVDQFDEVGTTIEKVVNG